MILFCTSDLGMRAAGYYARISAVEHILQRFISVCRRNKDARTQVVSLGAGFDTSFFKLWATDFAPTVYYELDFPEVTSKKQAIIKKHKVLQDCIAGKHVSFDDVPQPGKSDFPESPVARTDARNKIHGSPELTEDISSFPGIKFSSNRLGGGDIDGAVYKLLTADLRDVASLQAVLTAAGIDSSAPTLFLSECVLVYLEPEESCSIIAWAGQNFDRSVFVTYEQIRPHDAFGQIMSRNLEERGYSLRGLQAFPDITSQIARYRELGFRGCTVADMNDIYYRILPRTEVARIERLELFDEVEEWHLMSAHYCIAVAVNDSKAPLGVSSASATYAHQRADKHAHDASATRDVVTDMAAPAPKKPRTSTSAAIDTTLSPQELAAEVVHAHQTDIGTSPKLRVRGQSISSSGNSTEMDAVSSAIAFASGTTVEAVELTPRDSSLPATPTGGDPGCIDRIRTHAGEVVIGGASVDFEAIAEAEHEMMHARHMREAVGTDAFREQSSRAGSKSQSAPAPGLAAYDSESVKAAAHGVTLFSVLFPVENWNNLPPSPKPAVHKFMA
jgi:tRNA wybutosine-synthesizing protein 4